MSRPGLPAIAAGAWQCILDPLLPLFLSRARLPLGLRAAERALCEAGLVSGAALRVLEEGSQGGGSGAESSVDLSGSAPGRGWHALCMPRPVLSSFGSIVYSVGGVSTGRGSPRLGELAGGKMPPVVAQMVALVEALSTFSPGLWGSDFEIVDGGFVK